MHRNSVHIITDTCRFNYRIIIFTSVTSVNVDVDVCKANKLLFALLQEVGFSTTAFNPLFVIGIIFFKLARIQTSQLLVYAY